MYGSRMECDMFVYLCFLPAVVERLRRLRLLGPLNIGDPDAHLDILGRKFWLFPDAIWTKSHHFEAGSKSRQKS